MPSIIAISAGSSAPNPASTSAASRTDQGLGKRRWPVERSNAWVLENKRLALRYDRLGFIIQSLLQAACIFLVAGRVAKRIVKTASKWCIR